jgi:TatA/E family protein of Tat protein translocase
MLGPQDLWIALALGVFFFGSKKLPELSRSLGQAMSEFKKGVAGGAQDDTTPAASASSKSDEPSQAAKSDAGQSH